MTGLRAFTDSRVPSPDASLPGRAGRGQAAVATGRCSPQHFAKCKVMILSAVEKEGRNNDSVCQEQRKLPRTGEVTSPQLSDAGTHCRGEKSGFGDGHETWPWALTLGTSEPIQVSQENLNPLLHTPSVSWVLGGKATEGELVVQNLDLSTNLLKVTAGCPSEAASFSLSCHVRTL